MSLLLSAEEQPGYWFTVRPTGHLVVIHKEIILVFYSGGLSLTKHQDLLGIPDAAARPRPSASNNAAPSLSKRQLVPPLHFGCAGLQMNLSPCK